MNNVICTLIFNASCVRTITFHTPETLVMINEILGSPKEYIIYLLNSTYIVISNVEIVYCKLSPFNFATLIFIICIIPKNNS